MSSKVFVVKYVEYDDSGVVCAFTTQEQAQIYANAMDLEKDSEDLHFYVTELNLYNTFEDIENG